MQKLLNISDTQLSYITNADAGQGLLKVGGALVPFEDKFPRGTKLYKKNDNQVRGVETMNKERRERAAFRVALFMWKGVINGCTKAEAKDDETKSA